MCLSVYYCVCASDVTWWSFSANEVEGGQREEGERKKEGRKRGRILLCEPEHTPVCVMSCCSLKNRPAARAARSAQAAGREG